MSIQFLAKPSLTANQIKMCQHYLLSLQYGNIPADDSLGFINFICQRFGATVDELAWSLERIKAYDNQMRCQHCGVMQQVTQPIATMPYRTRQPHWVCHSCLHFLSYKIDSVSGYPIYTQGQMYQNLDYDCPF